MPKKQPKIKPSKKQVDADLEFEDEWLADKMSKDYKMEFSRFDSGLHKGRRLVKITGKKSAGTDMLMLREVKERAKEISDHWKKMGQKGQIATRFDYWGIGTRSGEFTDFSEPIDVYNPTKYYDWASHKEKIKEKFHLTDFQLEAIIQEETAIGTWTIYIIDG